MSVPGLKREVAAYKRRQHRFEDLAEFLEQVFRRAAREWAPTAVVQARAKTIASFAEKLVRKTKAGKYRRPLRDMEDLCGVRVVVGSAVQVGRIDEFLRSQFPIRSDEDVARRLGTKEFGYRSLHYVAVLKHPGITIGHQTAKVPPRLLGLKFEVQVRTFFQHTWAEAGHRLSYKSVFPIPQKYDRELHSLAGTLETAERAFDRVDADTQTFAQEYGAHLTRKQRDEQFVVLETVLNVDPRNERIALQVAQLAMHNGDWDKAAGVLLPFRRSPSPSVLRTLGTALCRASSEHPQRDAFRLGQRLLAGCKNDPLAAAALAETEPDPDMALRHWRDAAARNPTDPTIVTEHLAAEAAERWDESIISAARFAIDEAMDHCSSRIRLGISAARNLLLLGVLRQLVGQTRESFAAMAAALCQEPLLFDLRRASRMLDRFQEAHRRNPTAPDCEWARRLLLLGRAIRCRDNDAREALLALSTPGVSKLGAPLVIVAGACRRPASRSIERYRSLLFESFRNYRGTVISGGTRVGIPRLVAALGELRPEEIRTIGYCPKVLPPKTVTDRRYREIRRTDGRGFSPLEPIQNWIDALADGIAPASVKLLGISGGIIAGMEYQLALALGGQVGLVERSGGAVDLLLQDPEWSNVPGLVPLAADPLVARTFIETGASVQLGPKQRDAIAGGAHETYRRNEKAALACDGSMVPWADLPDYLKDSNRQQVDHIFAKLREIGCEARPISAPGMPVSRLGVEEVERLSRMEHIRWMQEKLRAGWRYGLKKDAAAKTHPDILDWDVLPESQKRKDRDAVLAIPALLRRARLKICRVRSR